MRVLVSGASGLIGTALVTALRAGGHSAVRLARPGSGVQPGDLCWDPAAGELDPSQLEGVDAVVNLAGASIGEGRWTPARKQVLRASRIALTHNLARSLMASPRHPAVLVSASAIGYYGDRGDEELTEASPAGSDFLAKLACEWEAEARTAAQAGIRVVTPRLGVVLASRGGALARMLPLFRLGLGGRLGSGRQWMSWIALEDAVAVIQTALEDARFRGAINAVAPEPVTNAAFTRALAGALRRPGRFTVPAFALRLALGEMAQPLLLASQRVLPARLKELGFVFRQPHLGPALAHLLEAEPS